MSTESSTYVIDSEFSFYGQYNVLLSF
jgi:hypothetical protein